MKRPVAGVAMGLLLDASGSAVILTDILGLEDALGDMDFKVAGDGESITAFQMDIKVEGITMQVLEQALAAAQVRCPLMQCAALFCTAGAAAGARRGAGVLASTAVCIGEETIRIFSLSQPPSRALAISADHP